MSRRAVGLLAVLLSLTLPPTAHASRLAQSGAVLTFAADAGKTNALSIRGTSGVTVERLASDTDPIAAFPAGCIESTAGTEYSCAGVTRVVVEAGDVNDSIDASALASAAVTTNGGDGADTLWGGSQNDALSGGDGDDQLLPGDGTDTVSGGDGIDRVIFELSATPTYTLDGAANDGPDNDTIGSDIEDVTGAAADPAQTMTMVGDDGPNRLVATQGKAAINGHGGSDVLEGGAQDDTFDARDGSPDRVLCGGGTDTALVDTVDTVSPTCETVQITAVAGGLTDDKPPAIAWTAPALKARISGATPTTVAVNASDDRGVAKVQFLDDDRLVCEDTTAPYSCTYRAHGGDVGRNTLTAIAVDGANQTTSVRRPVTVGKFRASLTLGLKPRRDRRAPYSFRASGRLRLPSTVTRGQGCKGRVKVKAKVGKRTIQTRSLKLSRTCRYGGRFRFASRPAKRLRFSARFGGNRIVNPRSARAHRARTV